MTPYPDYDDMQIARMREEAANRPPSGKPYDPLATPTMEQLGLGGPLVLDYDDWMINSARERMGGR